MSDPRRLRRERLCAGLALLALLLVFFGEPLARLGSGVWSTADLTQSFGFTQLQPGHVPANRLLSDPPFQMQPWLHFALEELRAGRLPLWNPYNGGGQPLFANYQSALLSPFHLPFLLLPFGAALVASALLKLAALGAFTYLLLREWKLAPLAAFGGALAFAFCGHNVYCLAYPHPGALVALPAGLWCAERALTHWRSAREHESARGPTARASADAARRWAHVPWLVGLALAFGAGALAGHPEPFFFAALLVGALVLVRLAQLAWSARHARGQLVPVLGLAGAFFAAAALGTGLAAVQILPFLEYLEHSAALKVRAHNQEAFLLAQWPLLAYPDLFGNPSTAFWPRLTLPAPNYEGANMLYPGALVLALAALGASTRRARGAALALLALLALWFVYAYDLFGAAALAARVPLLELAPINRSQPISLFALACLAAFGLERVLHPARELEPRGRALRALALLAGCALLGFAFHRGARELLALRAAELGPPQALAEHARAHLFEIELALAVGGLGLAAAAFARPGRVRAACCALALAAIFAQSAWIARDYNPTIDERHFYPRTEAVEALARETRGELCAMVGEAPLPAESNLVYRIAMLANYDALAVAEHDLALNLMFEPRQMAKNPRVASERALRMFGARYVLHPGEWLPFDTEFDAVLRLREQRAQLRRIEPGQEYVQHWRAARTGLQAAMLTVAFAPGALDGELELVLEDEQSGALLARRAWSAAELAQGARAPRAIAAGLPAPAGVLARELVLDCAPRADSAGRAYRLRARSSASSAERAPALVLLPIAAPAGTRAELRAHAESDEPPSALAGMLRSDLSYAWRSLEPVAELRGLRLARYAPSLGRYYAVDGWRRCETLKSLGTALLDPGFDPYREVLFHADQGPSGAPPRAEERGAAQAARVLEELPNRVRLELERERPGLLVVARSHYPGWRARVNGASVPLWRANHAFSALPLPAGPVSIELEYAPASLSRGLALSAACALALLGAGVYARMRARAARAAGEPSA